MLDLGRGLVRAELVRRPSTSNRSPWVADVALEDGRSALAHCPALDMGGLCVPGTQLLMKQAVDSRGQPVGSKAVGAYGTPKCEYILQLVWIAEPENADMGGCWCAAHPSLGERLAATLLERGLIKEVPKSTDIRKEVSGVGGSNMRADFVVQHGKNAATVVEVKTVLNTDYNPATAPARKECVYLGADEPYRRAGIFPWGRVAQTGPDGECVVSARAIKHVDELAALAQKRSASARWLPLLLFMVVRPDAVSMRINEESCPSFARHAVAAKAAGVRIVAHKVRWGKGRDAGRAFWMGTVPVLIPQTGTKRPAPKTGTKRPASSLASKRRVSARTCPK